MGKTREYSIQPEPKKAKARKKALSQQAQLTPEQEARLAAFDAIVKRRDEEWAAMTPEERAEEDAAWVRVKATINGDRAGYRQVFVDE